MTVQPPPARPSAITRAALALQVFLLRRNWMGAMGEQIMVITTTGRKTGKTYSVPIGYLRDGETIIALTNAQSPSNWFRNLQKIPHAVLEIKGQKLRVRAHPVSSPEERARLFGLYRQQRAANFHNYFGVPIESPEADLQKALATRQFIRFEIQP